MRAGILVLWRDHDACLNELEIRAFWDNDHRDAFALGSVVAAEHDFKVLALVDSLEATEHDGKDVAICVTEMRTSVLCEQRRATSASVLPASLGAPEGEPPPPFSRRAHAVTLFSYDVVA